MKRANGFIATSLLYSFFLAFVTIFVAMIAIYLQNRIYLIKLEDSSKASIYIREMKEKIDNTSVTNPTVKINGGANKQLQSYTGSIFKDNANATCNFAKCETIYYDEGIYILEGCTSC